MGIVLLILFTLLIANITIIVITNAQTVFSSESFRDHPQPLFFPKHTTLIPKECRPHTGCTWSQKRNIYPVNSHKLPVDEIKNCSEAWKDCHLYQDCIEGQCTDKTYYL
jgi:hypothetical protein